MSKTGKSGFITKLQAILNNIELEIIVSWSNSGQSFVIYNVQYFEQSVSHNYFRHRKMNSFIRQLNMYGFHKIKSEKSWMEFSHPCFKKNRPEDYHLIDRRRSGDSQPKLELKMINQFYSEKNLFDEEKYSSKLDCSLSVIQSMGELNWKNFTFSRSQMSIKLNESLTSLQQIELPELTFENNNEETELFGRETEAQSKLSTRQEVDEIQKMLRFNESQQNEYIY